MPKTPAEIRDLARKFVTAAAAAEQLPDIEGELMAALEENGNGGTWALRGGEGQVYLIGDSELIRHYAEGRNGIPFLDLGASEEARGAEAEAAKMPNPKKAAAAKRRSA